MAENSVGLNVRFSSDGKGLVADVDDVRRAFRRLDDQNKKNKRGMGDFNKSTTTASERLSVLGGQMRSVANQAGIMATVVGTAAVAALTKLVSTGLQAGDNLAKTADKLGVTTEKLAGLRLAAEQTGVSTSQFDTALQRLTRRTAEAAEGTGVAQEAFKALGLDASNLVNLSPDQTLAQIADAMAGVETQSQKVKLAFQLFDSEGVALVNTLALGSGGLEDFQELARTTGIAISRDMAGKIEDANDSLNTLGQFFSGLGLNLAGQFAPLLATIGDKAFDAGEELGGMGKVSEKVFEFIIDAAVKTLNVMDGFVRVSKLAGIGFQVLGTGFAKAIDFMVSILQHSPPGIAVRTFLGAFGFFRGEEFNLPDYNESALHKAIEAFELDLASLAARVDSILLTPLAGEQLRELEIESRKRHKSATEGATEYKTVMESIEELLARLATQTKDSASQVATAWSDAANTIERVFRDVINGQIRNLRDLGQSFSGGGGLLGILLGGSLFQQVSGGGGANAGGSGFNFSNVAGLVGAGGGSDVLGVGGLLATLGAAQGAATYYGTTAIGNLFGAGSGIAQGAGTLAGNLYASNYAVGSGLGFSGQAAVGAGGLATAGAGIVGAYGGNALGEALLGKEANSNYGATAGAVSGAALGATYGSIGGPWGALIGAAIGAIIDVAAGGDGRTRFAGGIIAGDAGNPRNIVAQETAASGLQITGVSNRIGDGGAGTRSLVDAVLQIDEALTAALTNAGIAVDFSNTVLPGRSGQAGGAGSGAFFGAFGFNGRNQGTSLAEAANEFTVAWLNEINDALPARVRTLLEGVNPVAEELVNGVAAALRVDELLNLDVIDEIAGVIETAETATESLLDTYQDLTDQVLEATDGIDGSADSLLNLASVLGDQKTIAYELVAAYRQVGIEVDSLLGNTIQNIRESVLSDEELYALRREQISDLQSQIAGELSPEALRDIAQQIDRLANSAFNLLDDSQQDGLAPGFIDFLIGVNDQIQDQINAGLGQISQSETNIRDRVDLIGADQFESSVSTFAEAVARFTNAEITVNIEDGIGRFRFGDFIGSEVNA